MADFLSPEERSHRMAAISSRGNETTELKMLDLLRTNRITGWRRQLPLPGRPDFAFSCEKLAVFVDGCFWHGCPRCYRAPETRRQFWRDKVEGNRRRDRRVNLQLRKRGWRVARIWECALRTHPDTMVRKIRRMLREAKS